MSLPHTFFVGGGISALPYVNTVIDGVGVKATYSSSNSVIIPTAAFDNPTLYSNAGATLNTNEAYWVIAKVLATSNFNYIYFRNKIRDTAGATTPYSEFFNGDVQIGGVAVNGTVYIPSSSSVINAETSTDLTASTPTSWTPVSLGQVTAPGLAHLTSDVVTSSTETGRLANPIGDGFLYTETSSPTVFGSHVWGRLAISGTAGKTVTVLVGTDAASTEYFEIFLGN